MNSSQNLVSHLSFDRERTAGICDTFPPFLIKLIILQNRIKILAARFSQFDGRLIYYYFYIVYVSTRCLREELLSKQQ